jgi:hypothetical protein
MSKNDLTVKYEPFKEIIIMERTHFATAGLYWVDGVVFLYFPLPASTAAVAKALIETGRVYWTFVGYSFMPKYEPTIETKEKMIVPVVDISADPVLKKVAQWLKEQN